MNADAPGDVMPTMPDEVRDKAREAADDATDRWWNDRPPDGEERPVDQAASDAAAKVAYAAGRADERARLVAWLRGKARHWRAAETDPRQHPRNAEDCDLRASQYDFDANRVERGEHLDD